MADLPATFEVTHILDDTPVQHLGHVLFRDEQGNLLRARPGHKATHISVYNRRLAEQAAVQADVGKAEEVERAAQPPPPPAIGEMEHVPAEVAWAILRAAAWPLYGEPIGYGEAIDGSSATLDGTCDDGTARVKVCLKGGRWLVVRVPRQVPFEVVG